jgi:hypothetical protein
VIVVGVLAPGSASFLADIATRAAAAGARTEVLGVTPAGEAGDRQLGELAAARVGHATVIRSAASGIEAADLDLALRYLPEVRVIVLVSPGPALLSTAAAAASWSGASLIVVGPLEAEAAAALGPATAGPGAPIVLEPPARDADGAFSGVVAALAVRLDAGEDAAKAWRATVATLAIDPA